MLQFVTIYFLSVVGRGIGGPGMSLRIPPLELSDGPGVGAGAIGGAAAGLSLCFASIVEGGSTGAWCATLTEALTICVNEAAVMGVEAAVGGRDVAAAAAGAGEIRLFAELLESCVL